MASLRNIVRCVCGISVYFRVSGLVHTISQIQRKSDWVPRIWHESGGGGYWAEVLEIPGCATEGDAWKELLHNVSEAIANCLSVDVEDIPVTIQITFLKITV